MICDRCGSPTKDKWITSKKQGKNFGKSFKLLECTGQCMDGRFPYSFFPPRDSAHAVAPQPQGFQSPQQGVVNPNERQAPSYVLDIIERLKTIDSKLVEIKGALKIGGRANFTHEEMNPDENVPF